MLSVSFISPPTLPDNRRHHSVVAHIKLGRGHWWGSHVGSCFKMFMCPDNGLIFSSLVTCWIAEPHVWWQSHWTDPHNCIPAFIIVTTNGALIWLDHQCATHQQKIPPGLPRDLKTACLGYDYVPRVKIGQR